MKHLLPYVAFATLLASCGPKASQPDPMALANDSLSQVIAAKDSIINDAFNSIGEIAANINQIAEREKLVTKQTSAGGELTKPVKEQIAENIAVDEFRPTEERHEQIHDSPLLRNFPIANSSSFFLRRLGRGYFDG